MKIDPDLKKKRSNINPAIYLGKRSCIKKKFLFFNNPNVADPCYIWSYPFLGVPLLFWLLKKDVTKRLQKKDSFSALKNPGIP